MENSNPNIGDAKTFTEEEIKEQLKFLDRAHRMTCSDPKDPNRTTSYSTSASIIRQLMSELSIRSN